jgi:hypothetical protein
MTIEEAILEKVRALPPDKQQLVLTFVGSLGKAEAVKRPLRSPRGLWAKYKVSVTDEDIAEIRREMWKPFPRQQS